MLQIFCMQSVIASAVPDTVTALSVEFGSISDATWIEAPVVWRIKMNKYWLQKNYLYFCNFQKVSCTSFPQISKGLILEI